MFVSSATSSRSPSPRCVRRAASFDRVPAHRIIHAMLLPALVLASLAGCTDDDDMPPSDPADDRPAPVFLRQSEGRAAISRQDEYVAAMSQFDRQSRTGSLQPVTVDEYLRAMQDHVLAFSDTDQQSIAAGLDTVLDRMAALGLRPPAEPSELHFIRTDGTEEGNADAYTRGNAIFLCAKYFASDPGLQVHIIAHELFHVWSRLNPDVVRWPTHEALGFVRARGASFPASLAERRIANPDDPLVNETIHVTLDGAPVEAFLAMIARSDYQGGDAFNYLQLQLVDSASGAVHPLESAQGLLEQIGTTTNNILSAEEISAEHFAIGVLQDLPINDPALIEAVLAPFAP